MPKPPAKPPEEIKPLKFTLEWYTSLYVIFIIGICLLFLSINSNNSIYSYSFNGYTIEYVKVLGIITISIPITHISFSLLLHRISKLFKLKPNTNEGGQWPPAIMGVVEAVMYPIALLIGHSEFIGFWIALKLAGNWGWWNPEHLSNTKKATPKKEILTEQHKGRRLYFQSLLGNAFSIFGSVVTYAAIKIFAIEGPTILIAQ